MTVPTQPIDLPFGGGVDQKTREEKLAPGTFQTLSNLRVLKRGSYQKRFGNEPVGRNAITGGTIPVGKRLMSYRDELLQTDGLNLYTRSATLDAWRKAPGYAPQLNITQQAVAPLQFGARVYDSAYVNGYHVVTYALPVLGDFMGIYATIIDASNGAVVQSPVVLLDGADGLLDSGSVPNVVLVTAGNVAVIVYALDGDQGGNITTSWIDTTSATTISAGWSVPANTITDARATGNITNLFDACSLGGGLFAIAYLNNRFEPTDDDTITVRTYDLAIVQQATVNVVAKNAEVTIPALSIDGTAGDVIWLAWPFSNSVSTSVIGLNPATLATTATLATVITTASVATNVIVTYTGNQTGTVVAWNDGSEATYIRNFGVSAGAVTPSGGSFKAFWVAPSHRPFAANGRWYMGIRGASPGNTQQVLISDLTATLADAIATTSPPLVVGYMRVVGNPQPRLAYRLALQQTGAGPRASALSSTKAVLAIAGVQNATSAALELFSLDWLATNVSQPSPMLGGLGMSGSPPSFYDSVRSSEIGFFFRPHIASATPSGVGLTGNYKYVAVYEQIDAKGQWHQSSPSDPALVTLANQGASVTVSPLTATNRCDNSGDILLTPSQIRIAGYRTTDGGNVFYRLPAPIINTPTSLAGANVLQINDSTPDTALGAPLYAQPGVPNTAQVKATPPPFVSMIAHVDRLVGCEGKNVWYSGQAVPGEAPWFADAFQFSVEEGAGDVTGLASMDGSLVIFKRNRIFFVDGAGPGDSGAGGDFSSPQGIATDVGCIDPRSIVLMADGVMFQSLRGIELLTRARQMAPYFGNQIEDTLAAHPIVTSGVIDEAKGHVVFTLNDTEGGSTGATICWDYVNQVWTTGTFGDGTTEAVAARSAIMWGQNNGTVPVNTWLQSTGAIFQESTTSYLDNGAWISSALVTPWNHGGLVGLQMAIRAILLAQAKTPHDLTIGVYYDYDSSAPVDEQTWTSAQIAALATAREQLEIQFTRPECTAFQLRVIDATPSSGSVGTGQGSIFIGMQIDAADQGILVPMAEANRK